MNYLVNEDFLIDVGFIVTASNVLQGVETTNEFLQTLPKILYESVSFKTTGDIIGAIFCDKLITLIQGASVNPIEKGHPDIIPSAGIHASEALLRNYPHGLEVKVTIGSVKKDSGFRAGRKRIASLAGITWQAHHREVKHLMGFVWDFNNESNGFHYPIIVGAFYTNKLDEDDWGAIAGTKGRNTKVSAMVKSGKEKMGKGWVLMLNDPDYLQKLKKYLYIADIKK